MIFLQTTSIQIFHTNDLHSHFEQLPKIVSLINEKQNAFARQGEEVLVFDMGDHIDRFHPLTEATFGKANVKLMNKVGYNSVTIGNNEGITISHQALTDLYNEASFPVVVANLFEKNGCRPNWLKPYHIIQLANGLTIGVIGITIPFRPFYEALNWKVADPFKILPPLVKEVKKQADLVICLSHLGLNIDEEVAKQVKGIDVILGGHTHHVLENGMFVNQTIIHQAGKFGKYVGQLSITFNHHHKQISSYKAQCLDVDNYSPCEKTLDTIDQLTKLELTVLDEVVCTIPEPLTISWKKPSQFAHILATALKEWCKGEIGMVNSGVLLDNLPSGRITKGDIHRVCPHPINPCLVELNGQVLKEIISHAVSDEMVSKEIRGFGFRGKIMGISVFSGVTYETKILADGLSHIFNIKINGEKIEPNRLYEVATLDMFTFGHLFPAIAQAKVKRFFMPELLRDLLAWKLTENLQSK